MRKEARAFFTFFPEEYFYAFIFSLGQWLFAWVLRKNSLPFSWELI
jgi:hypothetical protein